MYGNLFPGIRVAVPHAGGGGCNLNILYTSVCARAKYACVLHTPFTFPSYETKRLYWALQILIIKCNELATVYERVMKYELDE